MLTGCVANEVVVKINEKIRSDSFYTETEILEKKFFFPDFDQYYESVHNNYHDNPLRHFILDFGSKN